MRKAIWLSVFCLWPAAALAEDITSAYTRWDLETSCQQVENGDGYTFAGAWSCPGHGGLRMMVAVSDDRSFVGFGKRPAETCAYGRTFSRFNTALSPVEWRLKGGKPFAVIQRWRVSTDDEGGSMTWLVVTALEGDEACPVHYVAGSYPEANAQARRAADNLAEDFDCAMDVPTVDSTVGADGIDFISCEEMRAR